MQAKETSGTCFRTHLDGSEYEEVHCKFGVVCGPAG